MIFMCRQSKTKKSRKHKNFPYSNLSLFSLFLCLSWNGVIGLYLFNKQIQYSGRLCGEGEGIGLRDAAGGGVSDGQTERCHSAVGRSHRAVRACCIEALFLLT